MIVRFAAIGEIVGNHCLNYLFIMHDSLDLKWPHVIKLLNVQGRVINHFLY